MGCEFVIQEYMQAIFRPWQKKKLQCTHVFPMFLSIAIRKTPFAEAQAAFFARYDSFNYATIIARKCKKKFQLRPNAVYKKNLKQEHRSSNTSASVTTIKKPNGNFLKIKTRTANHRCEVSARNCLDKSHVNFSRARFVLKIAFSRKRQPQH